MFVSIFTSRARLGVLGLLLAVFAAGCSGGQTSKEPAPKAVGQEPASTPPASVPPVDPKSFPAVVARVNGAEISQDDLLERAKAASRSDRSADPGSIAFYNQVLDDLISAELLFQDSKSKGLVPSDKEVEQRVSQIRARFPSAEKFTQTLSENGLTEERMKHALRRDLGIERLLQKEVTSAVSVDDAEVRKFFDDNAEKMRSAEELRVSHILVSADANASKQTLDQARNKAESLRSRALAGEDFAKLARENSDDPGSASLGGDLSWMGRGVMVPPFEEAAYALKVGEISPVIQTTFGFHVIKLVDKRPGKALLFDDVKDQIGRYLKEVAVQDQIGAKVKALREKAKVEVFI